MATKPTAGIKPDDYDEPFGAYIGWQLVVTASVGMAFSTIWTMLRLWTRQHISRALGPDDFLILAAWICATTLSIGDIMQCEYGTGTHLWEVELDDLGVFLKLQMVVGNFYGAALAFAKISILCFYLRVFEKRSFRILVYLAVGFVGCYAIAGVFVVVFSCNPVAASWDLSLAALPTTVCVNRPAAYLVQAAFNIFSDIFVILLPLYEIWKLQMRLRQRLTLMAIFGVGFAVCIISIIRLKSVAHLLQSADLTWDTTDILLWSTIETHATIVCACSPTLKPLFTRFLPNIFSSAKSSRGATGPYAMTSGRPRTHTGTYELGARRTKGDTDTESGVTTTIGRGRLKNGITTDSEEDILVKSGDEVFVTRTVEIQSGLRRVE